MIRVNCREWVWPVCLIMLAIVPVLAGAIRVVELSGDVEISSENARFVLSPLPVIVHIFSATTYCLLGAFQFVPGIRRNKLNLHKLSGRLLVPCGLVSAATGLWMTQFYLGSEYNSLALYWLRVFVGAAMIAAIFASIQALRRGKYKAHGAWMIRAYALGLGAGTQVLTGIPLLAFQLGSEVTVFVHMAAGWAINIVVAEWIIRREHLTGLSARGKGFTLST